MKLIGVHLSPYVRKVAVILQIKGLSYEQEPQMPGSDDPAFRAFSPLGKIPVLIDGDLAVPDSSVICEYLEEKYPQPSVMPSTIEARAQARFLEEYGDTRLVEVTSGIFVENFVNPKVFSKDTDTERVSRCINELIPPVFDYLETRVPADGFLFGDLVTADVCLVSPLINAEYGGYSVDASRWPKYAAYVGRVAAHPAVASTREIEARALAAMLPA